MDGILHSLPFTHQLYGSGIVTVAYLVQGIAEFGSGLSATPLLLLLNLLVALVAPLVVAADSLAFSRDTFKHASAYCSWSVAWCCYSSKQSLRKRI
jgi:hypothetical protein